MTEERPEWWAKAEPELRKAIDGFTDKLKSKLESKPSNIVSRKNPFLFRIRSAQNPSDLARKLIDAFMSSSEETMFGNVLEELAIIVCEYAKGGQKSGIENIDLEYIDETGARTIVQIKSGENWGNSGQHKSLRNAFGRATRTIKQSNRSQNVRCIEGCCYGRSRVDIKDTHERIVGDAFWKEISGWNGTADAILDLIGEYAENGLYALREAAHTNLVKYLREEGIAVGNALHWNKLLRTVNKRPDVADDFANGENREEADPE